MSIPVAEISVRSHAENTAVPIFRLRYNIIKRTNVQVFFVEFAVDPIRKEKQALCLDVKRI